MWFHSITILKVFSAVAAPQQMCIVIIIDKYDFYMVLFHHYVAVVAPQHFTSLLTTSSSSAFRGSKQDLEEFESGAYSPIFIQESDEKVKAEGRVNSWDLTRGRVPRCCQN